MLDAVQNADNREMSVAPTPDAQEDQVSATIRAAAVVLVLEAGSQDALAVANVRTRDDKDAVVMTDAIADKATGRVVAVRTLQAAIAAAEADVRSCSLHNN